MADTLTTNFSLVKVEVGASNDTWGQKLNNNADAIDAAMKANADAATAAQTDADAALAELTAAAADLFLVSNGVNAWAPKTAAEARTLLSIGNVENKSSATIRGELTSSNVTTALGYTPWHAGNDGAGSGLDADLLDGQHASAFALGGHSHDKLALQGVSDYNAITFTYETVTAFGGAVSVPNAPNASLANYWSGFDIYHVFSGGDYRTQIAAGSGAAADIHSRHMIAGVWQAWRKYWNDGNDGAGSGLDADTVDGVHASALAPKLNPAFTGAASFGGSAVFGTRTVIADPADGSGNSAVRIDGAGNLGDGRIHIGYRAADGLVYNYLRGLGGTQIEGPLTVQGQIAWHAGNGGPGSGMDADTVDGRQAAEFALLASPIFTGNPKAPTQATSDNSTNIATTAFVASKINTLDTGVTSVNGRAGAVALVSGDVTTALGYTPLNQAAYTAADVLAKLKTVDGPLSGVDAATVAGRQAAEMPKFAVSGLNGGRIFIQALGADPTSLPGDIVFEY